MVRCLFILKLVALMVGAGTFYVKLLRSNLERNLVDLRHIAGGQIVPVFYNLFVNASSDTTRVLRLARQQLSSLDPKQHQLRITSIGALKNISEAGLDRLLSQMTFFSHVISGGEERTLHELWSFCRADPSHVVAYLHSKGSFHPGKAQDKWREYLTAGVLSKECLSLRKSAEKCNVCSSRMSPLPFPHTPGNMWTARCSYVSKLLDPLLFRLKMQRWKERNENSSTRNMFQIWQGPNCTRGIPKNCLGLGRFALEHWLYSHPDVLPCDLDASRKYLWGYPIPSQTQAMMAFIGGPKVLRPAPRFDLATYDVPGCCKYGFNITQRLDEYEFLYQLRPPPTWWGWKFFETG